MFVFLPTLSLSKIRSASDVGQTLLNMVVGVQQSLITLGINNVGHTIFIFIGYFVLGWKRQSIQMLLSIMWAAFCYIYI